MGCAGSRDKVAGETPKKIRKPKPWKRPEAITGAQLTQMREEFWDTAPHYGGRKEIWQLRKISLSTTISSGGSCVRMKEKSYLIINGSERRVAKME